MIIKKFWKKLLQVSFNCESVLEPYSIGWDFNVLIQICWYVSLLIWKYTILKTSLIIKIATIAYAK